jgi:hypothetical protein
MKKILLLLTVCLVAVACNKNKQAVKKLDGEWKANSILVKASFGEIEGSFDILAIDPSASATLVFEECNIKNGEYCDGNLEFVTSDSTISDDFLFTVIDDGTKIEVLDSGDVNVITIEELTKTDCTIKWFRDGLDLTFDLTKQ